MQTCPAGPNDPSPIEPRLALQPLGAPADAVRYAVVEELLERNPAEGIPHPRSPQRKGIALKPEQVQLLARSFGDEQARIAFLTFVLTGVRRAELQALRWRDVDLIENVLRVAESKTETGLRAIALTPGLHEELWQHRRRSAFKGDDERVFCHPDRGTIYRYESSSGRSRGPGWNGRRG